MQAESVEVPVLAKDKIIVALDVADQAAANRIIDRLAGQATWFKIGLQLFCQEGPPVVAAVKASGAHVFLDLKLHDIPNTVEHAAVAAGRLGADFLTVHLLGGQAMNRVAKKAVAGTGTRLLGVTVLTSHDAAGLAELGISPSVPDEVERLATIADAAGLEGLVASPQEIAPLRARFGSRFQLVIPGIRPAWSAANDQKRTLAPAAALAAGADFLVIGRPITAADDPAESFRRVVGEIESGER